MGMLCLILLQEPVRAVVTRPEATWVEPTIVNMVLWLRLIAELTGAMIVAAGVALAFARLIRVFSAAGSENYNQVRLQLARYLSLALEFQLGADILSTAISPTWDQIGKLGAIAIIRTALNYFLSVEMREERRLSNTEAGHISEEGGRGQQ
jgi:uncharacterized membrane protein